MRPADVIRALARAVAAPTLRIARAAPRRFTPARALPVALGVLLAAATVGSGAPGPAIAQGAAAAGRAVGTVTVTAFTPQGDDAREVRQATARFSAPVVSFGDPRAPAPYDVACAPSQKGSGRWADPRSWLYDFATDVPPGVVCTFTPRAGLKAADGTPVAAAPFRFGTGGPAIIASLPDEGDERIDEQQIFLLGLDAPADAASVRERASCTVTGIAERIGVDVLTGEARRDVLAGQLRQNRWQLQRLTRRGREPDGDDADAASPAPPAPAAAASAATGRTPPTAEQRAAARNARLDALPITVLRCARPLPPKAVVTLTWGTGIRTASGLPTRDTQTLAYKVRDDFLASQTCERVNARGGCIPVLPITLNFTAPVARERAGAVTLRGPDGRSWPAQVARDENLVSQVSFDGPFPERARLTLQVPDGLVDDAGRRLGNAASFPLSIEIDEDPPLIKFASRFGVLEAAADPALPVSVRNIEPVLKGLKVSSAAGASGAGGSTQGRHARIADDDAELLAWYVKVTRGPVPPPRRRGEDGVRFVDRPGALPLLDGDVAAGAQPLELPRPGGDKAFELIGIPLAERGFHVVEFASPRLGAALHGEPQPYYVSAGALVTDLAVHFKLGRESSLAWVTRLSDGRPVEGARVQVNDCTGRRLWDGTSGAGGVARIAEALPVRSDWQRCPHSAGALFVTARKDGDTTFMLTSWSDGIHSWQFNLQGGGAASGVQAHAVTDRALFRAGETVSMKLFARKRTGGGFEALDGGAMSPHARLIHVGSGQEFGVPVAWRNGAGEARWAIPKDAKLGTYRIELARASGSGTLDAGEFRVEAFRVPLMRATLKAPAVPLVDARKVEIDAQLGYLAGGPAAGAAVRFRTRLVPHAPDHPEHEDFTFGGRAPKEGVHALRGGDDDEDADDASGGTSGGMPSGGDDDTAAVPRLDGPAATRNVTLDAQGGARVGFDRLPASVDPLALEVEMEYADPNGQRLTASTRAVLLPSALALGLRMQSPWATRERLAFQVVALDVAGHPVAGQKVEVDAYVRERRAYRKRLLGGFYAYEQSEEIRRAGRACSGRTDAQGLLVCDGAAPATGDLILVARGDDPQGHAAVARREVGVMDGRGDGWFEAGASDRIDLVADRRAYAPGDTARIEVRMPFRTATALVTVEREGVLDARTVQLTASDPFVSVPIAGHYGPNAYVSVMVVRGRVDPQVPGPFAWLKRMVWRAATAIGLPMQRPDERDTRPTALVDLTRPAFRLGLTQIKVGWDAYRLDVKVAADRPAYRVRETARVQVAVADAQGRPMPGAEVALAAVDEGLLALAPNTSWQLLDAMMQRRRIEVETSTNQSQVIGKRHFGRKAAAPGGGGGGAGSARELFDTLLLWKGRVTLDAQGRATVDVPLNDALTSFRIVAIAHEGDAHFGTGSTTVRTTQDLMLFAGLPPRVREGDAFSALLTVRNASDRPLVVQLGASLQVDARAAQPVPPPAGSERLQLAPGAAQVVAFPASVPYDAQQLAWTFTAREEAAAKTAASTGAAPTTAPSAPASTAAPAAGAAPPSPLARDTVKASQTVGLAQPVRVLQRTLEQVAPGQPLSFPVERPADAVPGRGGIDVRLAASLAGDLGALQEYMRRYPFSCLEQRTSKAVALEDTAMWQRIAADVPVYLDRDGLARYFPTPVLEGSDVLTAYVLSVSEAAGLELPEEALQPMLRGLAGFVEGRVRRGGALPTADLALRKLAAIEALARHGAARPAMLQSIDVTPSLWPTSAVLDWLSILQRLEGVPQRAQRTEEARQVLRTRMTFNGTTLGFSTERDDALWWLMVSADQNAVRALLLLAPEPAFRDDAGRLARGALGRQQRGHWDTTVANAWGVVALRRFQSAFERDAVTGSSSVQVGAAGARSLDWARAQRPSTADPTQGAPEGPTVAARFDWPAGRVPLTVTHAGSGRPWAFVTSRAAVPLKAPLSAGYQVRRTVTKLDAAGQPVAQAAGASPTWQRGDVYRVQLDIEAQADMTWVVADDPIPSGATILGSGLGGDSSQLAAGSGSGRGYAPSFQERGFDGLRAYWEWLPKGRTTLVYTVRLDNPGRFRLPSTHVEAMYAPEMFGDVPVADIEVQP